MRVKYQVNSWKTNHLDIKSILIMNNYIKADNSPFKQTFKVRYELLSLINIKFNTALFEHFLNGIKIFFEYYLPDNL